MDVKYKKFYLVVYSYGNGFGNMFFRATKFLDIKKAEETINKGLKDKYNIKKAQSVITNIIKITKEQYELSNK